MRLQNADCQLYFFVVNIVYLTYLRFTFLVHWYLYIKREHNEKVLPVLPPAAAHADNPRCCLATR